MATKYFFNGKQVKLAGIYSRIKSGIKNPPLGLDYGKILIIDTGSGAGSGYRAGIDGELESGANAIYSGITDVGAMQAAVKKGMWWRLAELIFRPDGGNAGASEVIYARAATTKAAEITYEFENASVTIKCRHEGVVGNGVLSGTHLEEGFSAMLEAGSVDTSKFRMSFYMGTYKGDDSFNNNLPYDGTERSLASPELLCRSIEVSGHAELKDWMEKDQTFSTFFKLDTYTITTDIITGTDVEEDLTVYGGVHTPALGGTESYTSANIDTILDYVKTMDYSLILCDNWGTGESDNDGADGLFNNKLLYHILEEARFEKMMVVGGGDDATEIDDSVAFAKSYDSDRVILVHAGISFVSRHTPTGFKEYPSIFKAAQVAGRLAGLPPEVPITFKGLKYDGEVHVLKEKEQERLVDAGVLYTIWDNDLTRFTVAQGINTLQNNDYFINEDGTTHSIQIRRISAQLNKEIVVNAKRQLFGNPNGVNRQTLTERTIKDWLDGYLKSKLGGLIISYDSITVERRQDTYHVTYRFAPNGEITKMFFTGFMID